MKKGAVFSSFKGFRRFIIAVLCFQIAALQPAMLLHAAGPRTQNAELSSEAKEVVAEMVDTYWKMIDVGHPVLVDFLKAAPNDKEMAIPRMNPNDPMVDEDPFFLRGQSWNYGSEASSRFNQVNIPQGFAQPFAYSIDHQGGVSITHPQWELTLNINAALRPVVETTDYLIFSLSKESGLFEQKAAGLGEPGEGLFYISKKELFQKFAVLSEGQIPFAANGAKVPVFYFPLPGAGWKDISVAFEWTHTDQVVVYNQENIPVPLAIEDFVEIEKQSRLNLLLAQSIELYFSGAGRGHAVAGTTSSTGIPIFDLPLPAPKSTFAFGLFTTNIYPRAAGFGANKTEVHWLRNAIANALLPQANAQVLEVFSNFTSLITPDVLDRIHFLNYLLGGSLIGSIVLKYTYYLEHFKEKYKLEEITTGSKISRVWRRVTGRAIAELKGNLDVYAHALATMSFAPGLTIVNTVEYLGERFAHKQMGPTNALVRRSFENTFGFSRKNMSQLPMNWLTFWLGAIVMGSVDSGLVVLQLLFVTPAIIEFMGQQVVSAGAGGATARFVTSEIIRNVYEYFKTGAYGYSGDQKFLVQGEVVRTVDAQLRQEGLDPTSKRVEKRRTEMINELLDQRMQLRGLPSDDEFLFDVMSSTKKFMKFLGYDSGFDLDAPERKDHGFILEDRARGLVIPALKKALATAEIMYQENPTETGRGVVEVYRKALAKYSYTMSMATGVANVNLSRTSPLPEPDTRTLRERFAAFNANRIQYLKEWLKNTRASIWASDVGTSMQREMVEPAKELRRAVTLFTYTGNLSEVLHKVPNYWRELSGSTVVMEASATLYNASFFSILEGDEEILMPKAQTLQQHQQAAEAHLADEMGGPKKDLLRDPFYRRLRLFNHVHTLKVDADKEQAITTYKPRDLSWYERIQFNRAQRAAETYIPATVDMHWLADKTVKPTFEGREPFLWQYTQELARQVGLWVNSPQESEFVKKVVDKTTENALKQLGTDEQRRYLSTLTREERLNYEGRVFAETFLNSYVEMSVHSDEYISHKSVERPGRLQWFRRHSVKHPALEKVIRPMFQVVETFFRNTNYKPGAMQMLARSVPIVPDLVFNMGRSLRVMPWFMTFGYFTSYYIWQIKMDYAIWGFFMALGFYGHASIEVLNRGMGNFGIKPMSDTWSKVKYSFIYSWVTYPVFIPVMMWAEPVVAAFDKYIEAPVKGLFKSCMQLLGG